MNQVSAKRWKEAVLIHRKKCQKILELSKLIRYVGVINEYGRTLSGVIQPGIKPMLNPETIKNEFFIVSSLLTLRKDQTKMFGILDDVVLKHKNVTLVCIPRKNLVYYISFTRNARSLHTIIKKIKNLV